MTDSREELRRRCAALDHFPPDQVVRRTEDDNHVTVAGLGGAFGPVDDLLAGRTARHEGGRRSLEPANAARTGAPRVPPDTADTTRARRSDPRAAA